jgi:ABC-2 type transport system ATP-binding protein
MIDVTHLTRTFGDRMAVEDLTFAIRSGEIFALLGPNGAGKTTTLRMLAGLIPPTAGHAVIDGIRLTRRTAGDIRARVGFLTEAPGLWERLTVRRNLLVYAGLYGLRNPGDAVDRSLALFGLADRADEQAAHLSKGMKQRLALARALVHEPPVVLLDEPTAGLDPQTARLVRDLVLQLRCDGRAIVLSTHNLDEAERIADRVGVLNRKLVAVDTPAALRHRLFGRRLQVVLAGDAAPFTDAVRAAGARDVRADGPVLSLAADDPDGLAPSIVRALVAAGAEVRRVMPEEPPLEDVYLKLVDGHKPGSPGAPGAGGTGDAP